MKKIIPLVLLTLILLCVPVLCQAYDNSQGQQQQNQDQQDQHKNTKDKSTNRNQNKSQTQSRSQNHPQNQPQYGRYGPQIQNHPRNRPHHTYQRLQSRLNRFRQYWVKWKQTHPNQRPDYFTLTISGRPYLLPNVYPGVWYYNGDYVGFIVPNGYVAVTQGQECYPGDSVNTTEFALFTDQSYADQDQEESMLESASTDN